MGRWARKPVNHTSWVAVVTPTDRPKPVRNRCLIELFCGVVCVVTLPFWHFCWCKGFCHRTESDLFLFLELLISIDMQFIVKRRPIEISSCSLLIRTSWIPIIDFLNRCNWCTFQHYKFTYFAIYCTPTKNWERYNGTTPSVRPSASLSSANFRRPDHNSIVMLNVWSHNFCLWPKYLQGR